MGKYIDDSDELDDEVEVTPNGEVIGENDSDEQTESGKAKQTPRDVDDEELEDADEGEVDPCVSLDGVDSEDDDSDEADVEEHKPSATVVKHDSGSTDCKKSKKDVKEASTKVKSDLDSAPVANTSSDTPVKAKKRWAFITLGILLGWVGVHYVYAKRWVFFVVHLAFLITMFAFPIVAVLWLVTWFGGALFIKKDGSGCRMS